MYMGQGLNPWLQEFGTAETGAGGVGVVVGGGAGDSLDRFVVMTQILRLWSVLPCRALTCQRASEECFVRWSPNSRWPHCII